MYENCKIKGPYKNSQGRYIYHLVYPDGWRKIILRYRYNMEIHLGRLLKEDEVVHHIDGNFTNDSIDNLQLFDSHSKHMQEHSPAYPPEEFICKWCSKKFQLDGNDLSSRKKLIKYKRNNYSGPFCSASCAGSYGCHKRWHSR